MKRIFFFILLISFMVNGLFAQTTIITHGFTSDGGAIDGWMLDMANTIRQRVGDGVVRAYNKTTGNFDYRVGSGNKTILLFDWMTESNDLQSGFSESAGAALFAALMKGYQQNDFNLDSLHFIGHSRGCAVNSEAVERLLVAGFPVEHVTYIDAHDWGGAGICSDYDCNPDSIQSGVEGWNGIGWADSYWQNNTLFDVSGRAVNGTYSEYLGTIGHTAIREWYAQTILDTTIHTGFYFALSGGGSDYRPPVLGIQRTPFFTFEADGILNGNFERGSTTFSDAIAGWWYHGGGGDAKIDQLHLQLNSSNNYKIHDRFYIPSDAKRIVSDFIVNTGDSSGSPPNVDKMMVLFNQNVVLNDIWVTTQMANWIQLSFDVSNYQNTIQTMEFRLVDKYGSTAHISSDVWIDNIQFVMSQASVGENNINSFDCSVFPNPVVSKATISYTLQHNDFVRVNVYNILGKEIANLSENIYNSKGRHEIVFDRSGINPGIYFYKIQAGKEAAEGKIVVIK
ncbi:MAG: T9SS type A sorting domain-containing protein [Bacteroidales bacterium]